MVGGSQVPNLLQPDAASTLVVSQDVDLVIPVIAHARVRALRETSDSYVLDDPKLPLLVFGLLNFLREGAVIETGGVRVPLPRPAGLLIEKLLTERSGLNGERDLLVALGLLRRRCCSRISRSCR